MTNTKYNYNAQRDDYLTPREFVSKVLSDNKLVYFDCDTCCTDFNVPAIVYYKKDGMYIFGKHSGNEDGLSGNWYGSNWCNPPFPACKKFVEKAAAEQKKGHTTYMLIPARVETKYWQEFILLNGRANRPNVEVEFLKKGLCFLNPDTKEPMQVFKNPLALVIFRGVNG